MYGCLLSTSGQMNRWMGVSYKDSLVYEIKLLLSFYIVGRLLEAWWVSEVFHLLRHKYSLYYVGHLTMEKRKP